MFWQKIGHLGELWFPDRGESLLQWRPGRVTPALEIHRILVSSCAHFLPFNRMKLGWLMLPVILSTSVYLCWTSCMLCYTDAAWHSKRWPIFKHYLLISVIHKTKPCYCWWWWSCGQYKMHSEQATWNYVLWGTGQIIFSGKSPPLGFNRQTVIMLAEGLGLDPDHFLFSTGEQVPGFPGG